MQLADAITITLTGNVMHSDGLRITQTLPINGGGYTLSGPGNLVHAAPTTTDTFITFTLNNLTLGNTGSAALAVMALLVQFGTTANINDSIFSGHSTTGGGAAIDHDSDANLTMRAS